MNVAEAHPGPWAATGLTVAAIFVSQLLAVTIMGREPATGVAATAMGVGIVVGYGVLGTLAARRVAPPVEERLGLRGFSARFLVPLLLLVPLVLLVSEIDNVARALFPPPPGPEDASVIDLLSSTTSLDLLQSAALIVGLVPVLEEWFFRGVVQQGLVARLGSVGGVALTSLLFALAHGASVVSVPIWLAGLMGSCLYGVAFGTLRLASGSLLAPILLHTAVNACGVFATAFPERLPIPGFNAPGGHSPPLLVAGAFLSCALGFGLCLRLGGGARRRRGRPGEA